MDEFTPRRYSAPVALNSSDTRRRCTGPAADLDEPDHKVSDEEYLAMLGAAYQRLDELEEELESSDSEHSRAYADEEEYDSPDPDDDAMDVDWLQSEESFDPEYEVKQPVQSTRTRFRPPSGVFLNTRTAAANTRAPRTSSVPPAQRLALDDASDDDEEDRTTGPLEYEIDASSARSVAERVGRRMMDEALQQERVRAFLASERPVQARNRTLELYGDLIPPGDRIYMHSTLANAVVRGKDPEEAAWNLIPAEHRERIYAENQSGPRDFTNSSSSSLATAPVVRQIQSAADSRRVHGMRYRPPDASDDEDDNDEDAVPGHTNGQVDLKQKERELDAALKKLKKKAIKNILNQ